VERQRKTVEEIGKRTRGSRSVIAGPDAGWLVRLSGLEKISGSH
jgi:hypothetical protein